jgi:ribosomal protein L31
MLCVPYNLIKKLDISEKNLHSREELLTNFFEKMKKNTHPNGYKELSVVLTNGEVFKTKSCYSRGDTLKLDVDPFNHPAWKKETTNFINSNNNQVNKFEKRFGAGFFGYGKPSTAN